ncbi:MAG: zinc ribbon domain-containing protein [Planctomycetota bacterium]
MPLYSYECESCGHADDEFQRMVDAPLTRCPVCGADTYSKQVSLPNTDMTEFHTPIEMLSVAGHPDDTAELQRKLGSDIEVRDGVPIARTRKQKLHVLKTLGYTEGN